MFESSGLEAEQIIKLWWVLLSVSILVFSIVTIFVILGYFRARKKSYSPVKEKNLKTTVTLSTISTLVLLVIIVFATFKYSKPVKASQSAEEVIEVVGKRWWWSVTYYDKDNAPLFKTANEIHIPVGKTVRLRLISDNVIHSFWVPELAGKVDTVPGRVNYITLTAKKPGVYRGYCAEYCGTQHSLMSFFVIAESPDEYERWKEVQSEPGIRPQSELAQHGSEIFVTAKCADCHTVRGLVEAKENGPDLTHLASRNSLASGTIPNRKGHLAGWIADPQSIKPGNLMPATPLPAKDFHALIHYLQTLR